MYRRLVQVAMCLLQDTKIDSHLRCEFSVWFYLIGDLKVHTEIIFHARKKIVFMMHTTDVQQIKRIQQVFSMCK